MTKLRLALVTGGDSGEISISLKSAKIIEQHIDKEKYDVYVINISKKQWVYMHNGKPYHVDKNDFSITVDRTKISFDVVFIAIHGTPGENGKLQGYFDLLTIPYTSSDLLSSAITFNKFYSRQLLQNSSYCAVANAVLVRKNDTVNIQNIIETTGLPCFVKPNEGGSSLGITKVVEEKQLRFAIEKALEIDEAALIEQFIAGREITCGVVSIDGQIMALPVTEIISKNEYFDFEAKYNKSKADEITPAEVPSHVTTNCQNVSRQLFRYFNCKGLVRFDYMLSNDGQLYFLEVNTIPGMTEESIVPQQAEVAGIPIKKLFSAIIENALESIK